MVWRIRQDRHGTARLLATWKSALRLSAIGVQDTADDLENICKLALAAKIFLDRSESQPTLVVGRL
jgi:hypothetical protein